jgi:hypothetical protein
VKLALEPIIAMLIVNGVVILIALSVVVMRNVTKTFVLVIILVRFNLQIHLVIIAFGAKYRVMTVIVVLNSVIQSPKRR